MTTLRPYLAIAAMLDRAATRFALGFLLGAAIAVSLNLLPFLLTYQAYGGDGYETIGFPFTFRRFGGFAPIYEFNSALLQIDISIGAVFALGTGWTAMKLLPLIVKHAGRGFPVVPN